MPKRTDIKSIMIIGAGPIVIGQACEFDYSGAQACKALREEGYRVVLVNSNPATIMTDPELADATYIEPITAEVVAKIIEKERPDALLPTMGGQTGLNTALELEAMGVLDKFNVEMIGAKRAAIEMAEDRKLFREAMDRLGLENPKATIVTAPKNSDGSANLNEGVQIALSALDKIGLPAIIRPAFTLGGTGGGVAYNRADYEHFCRTGMDASPVNQILVDESLLGWKGITTYSRITFKYNGSGTGDNYIETGSDSLAFKNSGGGSTLVLDLAHLGATFHGNILTNTDSSSDIGTTSKRWANIWVDNINGGTPTTGGPYLPLAGGTMTGNLRINDSLNLYIGSGTDLVLAHNGTNSYISNYQGDLYIENSATSGDIKFKADNKAGGTMEYFRVDGGLTKVVASQPFIFEDNVQAQFGSSADLKIWHDGSHSFISDEGTGDLKITTSAGAVRIDKGVSENMAIGFCSAA